MKNNLAVFINCLIENPSFDSQTKETLTSKPENFGSVCDLSEGFFKSVLKSGVVDFIVSQARAKERVKVQKALSGKKADKVLGIPKLEDANWAGTKNSSECLLILTEGDSAKALAMSGLDIVGRDKYGVFPLRGKLLNVRDASTAVLKNNVEIQAIVKILGLKFDCDYDSVDSLRYGGILIMADQDHDGSHIKGLIINFIHFFWPSLIKLNKFMKEFITPVIKAGKQGENQTSFFTLADFRTWLGEQPNPARLSIKYYKGLGTSTSKEAREYFSNLSKHVISFKYQGASDDTAIDLAFSKTKADDRKKWIEEFGLNETVDHSIKSLPYAEFVNKELVQYSLASNARAIPSVIDGLKPGQRKIIYGCFKRHLKSEIKVAQLCGYVAEHSAYHHGEESLSMTIIGLAQDYVGSNNINLLEPIGQFGTRSMGGKDAASPRYIFTKLNVLTRYLFPESDDNILKYLEDDGMSIEPEYYVPILPLVLVNGAAGIGMGWSTFVPCYNPLDLIANVKRLMNEQEPESILPWYYGFQGQIELDSSSPAVYNMYGTYKILDSETAEITELPVGVWTSNYKEFLETMMQGETKDRKIGDLKELHFRGGVKFRIGFKNDALDSLRENFEKKMKLHNTMSVRNMVLFDSEGKIKKYETAVEIIKEFYPVRLRFYELRKAHILKYLEVELRILENKTRFIDSLLDKAIDINNKKKNEIEELLQDNGFERFPTEKDSLVQDDDDGTTKNYNYLLSLRLWTLTYEKVLQLREQKRRKKEEFDAMFNSTAKELWLRDLDAFEEEYKRVVRLGSDIDNQEKR